MSRPAGAGILLAMLRNHETVKILARWVERSETHAEYHLSRWLMGFAALYPSYGGTFRGFQEYFHSLHG